MNGGIYVLLDIGIANSVTSNMVHMHYCVHFLAVQEMVWWYVKCRYFMCIGDSKD